MKFSLRIIGFILLVVAALLFPPVSFAQSGSSDGPESPAGVVLPEANDYATQVIRNAWDMSEFGDISQYLNQSGQADLLDNISVSDGVFSARALKGQASIVTLLFPNYKNGLLHVGEVGTIYPIDANRFKCLYIATKVNSRAPQGGEPMDQIIVNWYFDENLNNGVYGLTIPGIYLYPEAGSSAPSLRWKLYSLRLENATMALPQWTAWRNSPDGMWRGLAINPTVHYGTSFQIDWVRLTDCNAVSLSIPRSGNEPVSVFVTPEGTNREFQVLVNTTQNPISLDTQGFPPGRYTYAVRQGSGVVATDTFEIAKAPVATFEKPSYTSGVDYATQTGNAWDMNNASDVLSMECIIASFLDGLLSFDTYSFESQPPGCVNISTPTFPVTDPKIYLPVSTPIDTTQYRYLSFYMKAGGPWQNVPEGMIVRWIWLTQGTSGRQDYRCHQVSYGIPFDVVWREIHVDLFAESNGVPEENAGECPGMVAWRDGGPVLNLRFDPNENIMGQTMHQDIDWIRLTKMDEATRGKVFPIVVTLNIPWSELVSNTLYYTTNVSDPDQSVVQLYTSPTGAPSGMLVYLPLVTTQNSGGIIPSSGSRTFYWNTGAVSPGEYYICMTTSTSFGAGPTYCSEAPVSVR
ncbi:MAG: hypothetical protein EHM70_15970 [Chloroflexota bacterium]|nr:MAG: hypothetical protein EHM70_15970 [Chloroflexota bacterium]